MGCRQIILETNIDWQTTLDRIREKRKRETGQPLDGYILPGVFIRVTGKGHIKIKLEKFNVTLLVSPKGTLQVTYKTDHPMGDVLITPTDGVVIGVMESPTSGLEAIELGCLLYETGLSELLATIDGAKLKVRLRKYIRFYGAWEQDWVAMKKLRSEAFQEAVRTHLDCLVLARLLKRVVYDSRLRERIRALIDSHRDEKGRINSYDVMDILLDKNSLLDISEGMRSLFLKVV